MTEYYCMLYFSVFAVGLLWVVFSNQSISHALDCRQTYTGVISNVTFTSPGWPSAYPVNQDCQWKISSDPNTYIKLVITHYGLQTGCDDYILIKRPGEDVVTKCGGQPATPIKLYSAGNYMEVAFVSDDETQGESAQGFRAEFHVLPAACPTLQLSGASGTFSSPNYPDNYPGNIECVHFITVAHGHQVNLEFTFLELEYSANCSKDYVLVNTGSTLWLYCGKAIIPTPYMASLGRTMTVKFVSDGNHTYQGFNARYEAIPMPGITSSTLIQPTKTVSVAPASSVITPLPGIQDNLAGLYLVLPNYTIKGHTVEKLRTSSSIPCVLFCQRNTKCKSVTFVPFHQSSGVCILHDIRGTPGSLVERRNSMLYRSIV